ncbi:MAG: diacylglycerol kinase family lipid kinase [Thermoclostridium sp.]|nr:diacylglycerol kinase family lipid kinase [Thermoclostridium sp.]
MHLFILNPVAGKGHTLKILPEIEALMGKHALPYRVEITEAPGHATIIAREYIKENRKLRIYAVGGDGTLNEVLQGVVGSDACLGIIPAGTGNDFIKSFCAIRDPVKLLPFLVHADPVPVDICKMNDRYFLNIASAGFDADVVASTQRLKRLPLMKGKIAYIGGILLSLIRKKNIQATFMLDDETIVMKSLLLAAFANGRFYGGGMSPVPDARPDDGFLDVCLIEGMNRLKILMFFPRLIKGTHTKMREVTLRRCRSLTMESPQPVHVNADGELSQSTKVQIHLIPKGIQFIKPLS